MADDFFDYLPIFDTDYISEEAIWARRVEDANRGVEPGDPDYVDTRVGGWFHTVNMGGVLEDARLWDAISREVVAASHPGLAFGEYLDYHADDLGLERKAPTLAHGEVLFTGTPGALVPNDLRLSSRQTDPDVEAPEFRTTESGVISTALTTPVGLTTTPSTADGSLPAGTYHYKVAAINEYGATLPTADDAETIAGTGKVTLDWTDVAGAEGYKVYRGTTSGNHVLLAEVVNSNYTDAGQDSPGTEVVATENGTGGFFRADIEAMEPGAAFNVGTGAIDTQIAPIAGVTDVTNEAPLTDGADEESDDDLRERILLEFLGGGPGNMADYERWALAHPGVGRATVVPVDNGAGTVTVIIMDTDGDPLSQTVVDSLQYVMDPLAGKGAGTAPVGHTVTVTTPAQVLIDLVAVIDFDDGYTLDGGGGTVALRARLEQAIAHYIDRLEAGEDVVFDHVKAQFYTVPGVYKVTSLTVEGGAADVAITATPSQIAAVGVLNFS